MFGDSIDRNDSRYDDHCECCGLPPNDDRCINTDQAKDVRRAFRVCPVRVDLFILAPRVCEAGAYCDGCSICDADCAKAGA